MSKLIERQLADRVRGGLGEDVGSCEQQATAAVRFKASGMSCDITVEPPWGDCRLGESNPRPTHYKWHSGAGLRTRVGSMVDT
jgi:hypothetical protein